eukprot:8373140-Lingulodinium_polyedra.AAC.1
MGLATTSATHNEINVLAFAPRSQTFTLLRQCLALGVARLGNQEIVYARITRANQTAWGGTASGDR